jgi:hypothetical protein
MFNQKLSFRTQMALAELLVDAKEAAAKADPECTNTWSGEFVLWYDDRQRFPRLAIYVRHTTPEVGFGQWFTKVDGQIVADESLDFLMRA